MENSRKEKLLIIFALVLGIASLSIGFAAFSTTLNISSSVSVEPNSDSFSVKFSTESDSVVTDDVVPSYTSSGVLADGGKIDNSTYPTLRGLKAYFTEPGQYIEYEVYARNEGEYNAYLNNVNYVGSKTCISEGASATILNSVCEFINISVKIGENIYSDTVDICYPKEVQN